MRASFDISSPMAALQHEDLFNLSMKRPKKPPIAKDCLRSGNEEGVRHTLLSCVQAGDSTVETRAYSVWDPYYCVGFMIIS